MAAFPSQSKHRLTDLPFFYRFIATGFFSGYAPYAPGTAGSAAALVFFLIPSFSHIGILIPATILMFVLGGIAAEKAERLLGQDPSVVTMDEVVGMWLSLWFVPLSVYTIGAAFLLFRIFDIVKPSPARYFDRKTGGWNIMLDDVIAAIYTNIVMQILIRIV
jgi:phosphatidylglycerophosphatase A